MRCTMNDVYKILINASISFTYLFVISKLMGKKQIAQLDFIDYVVGISIGSIAAEFAFDAETPWYLFIIAMSVFFLLDLIVTLLGRKANFLKKFFKGRPLMLIENGKINYRNLKKSKIDVNDLIGLAREKNYFDINDIELAIFETNGSLSVLPKPNARPVVAQDFDIAEQKSKIVQTLIVDGSISKFSLEQIGKDKNWVYDKLQINSKKELKQILLATYDKNNDELNVFYKRK